MLGFLSSKEDRVKEACKHLRNWFNPVKIDVERGETSLGYNKPKSFSFPIVRCNEINIDKQVAGFHIYTDDNGMIIMENKTTIYSFPPDMLGRVINGLTSKKIVK
jgi:hypothetical protein